MSRIKVLIIDNNILVRRAVTSVLNKHKDIEILWLTDDSADMEKVVRHQKPDVVLLSIDDMHSNGLTILSNFRSRFPSLPIVIMSPRSTEGAEAVITGLRMGAIDFVTKPRHTNLILFAERHLEKRLEPIIRIASKIKVRKKLDEEILQSLIQPQKMFKDLTEQPSIRLSVDLVVIGGCTGGTKSLFTILSNLPENLAAPIVIVQHLPQTYAKILAEKLNANTRLMVREASNGIALQEGDVWIAPGGYHCEIGKTSYQPVLNTHRGLRENNMRPSIDILFRSAAEVYKKNTLGVILSGCGKDGLAGARAIKRAGGQIIVQDPQTAIAPELPLSIIQKGLTKEYFSPEELADEITNRVREGASKSKAHSQDTMVGNVLNF